MKKLLLICFIVISCKSKSQQAIKEPPANTYRVDSLRVDLSLLSENEREYLKRIDSLSLSIDLRNQAIRSVNAKVTKGNIESEVKLDGYSETEGGKVNKVVAFIKDKKRDMVYYFYYLDGKVVKIASDARDNPPFYAVTYYRGDSIYKPKELSDRSAEAVKAQSVVFLLTYFK